MQPIDQTPGKKTQLEFQVDGLGAASRQDALAELGCVRAAGSGPAGGLSNLIDEVYLLITARPSPSVRAQQRSGGAEGRSQPDSKWRPSELPVVGLEERNKAVSRSQEACSTGVGEGRLGRRGRVGGGGVP